MRYDVESVWNPMQAQLFNAQADVEKRAMELYKDNPDKARDYLTRYSMKWAEKTVQEAWRLGDLLWNRYDEKF
jgi:hypothetical protein